MASTEDEPSRNVRWEIAQLERIKPVLTETVTYDVDQDGRALIYFEIETDTLLEPVARNILDIEPITLRYFQPNQVGRIAPVVLSGRPDFPRDLLHLYPTPNNQPASLCLARAGLQTIYDVSGIWGVVMRLLDWLNDAKTETLFEDGWDPVPYLGGEVSALGYIDTKALQCYAHARPEGGFGFICAMISHMLGDAVFVQAATPIIDTSNEEQLESAKKQMRQSSNSNLPFQTAIPAVFVWPPRNQTEYDPSFTGWCDMASFKDGLLKTKTL